MYLVGSSSTSAAVQHRDVGGREDVAEELYDIQSDPQDNIDIAAFHEY